MIESTAAAAERAKEYEKRRGLHLGDVLGWGQDGIVYHTDVASAVKSLKYKELYQKELAVYRRWPAWTVPRRYDVVEFPTPLCSVRSDYDRIR